jgi:transcriptional regulator with XRE-family HTH domain
MTTIYENIGSKISELRGGYGGKGISQEALAKEIETTPNTISRWEKYIYKPSADDLFKLAKFFGVSISVFFPEVNLNPKQEALLSATGELDSNAMDELIEYAKFRKARQMLKEANSKK